MESQITTLFFLVAAVLSLSPVISVTDSVTFNATSDAPVVLLKDSNGETLVSKDGTFELGFFSPNGSDRRYLGIWYRNWSSTVVWVANRKDGLLEKTGYLCFTAVDRNLQILDGIRHSYWSAELEPLERSSGYNLRLSESGNLILTRGEEESIILWQSFDHPTDTFLSGMRMVPGLNLTSWTSPDDPSPGNYVFELDENLKQFVILNYSKPFWNSFDQIPVYLPKFLMNESTSNSSFMKLPIPKRGDSMSRILMGFDSRIQFYSSPDEAEPFWYAPSDICDLQWACGSFASCNREHRLPCKCLPGFVPKTPENWDSGDFSEGCTRNSQDCRKKSTAFLDVKEGRVEKETGKLPVDEDKCRNWCLDNCNCQAYSFYINRGGCKYWFSDVKDIDETAGVSGELKSLMVRVQNSDIESTKKDCKPCGTNTIPYPLSTGPDCGDVMYSSFICDADTGRLFFALPLNNKYTVTRIDKRSRKFFIQAGQENCENKAIGLNLSLPFKVHDDRCNDDMGDVSFGPFHDGKSFYEMAIVWDSPSEPLCSSDGDCYIWPDSSCRRKGREKRCLCDGNSRWDGINANCTPISPEETRWPLLYPIIFGCIGGVLLITGFALVILYVRKKTKSVGKKGRNFEENLALRMYDSEKRVKEFINSGHEFGEDDKKDINVPFFDLDCILAATDFFSVDNKLGQGGFGPVYKGKFPGGQEIAVKRLSSASAQGLEEFKNEVVLIAKLQHKNLVRLLGYCVEGNEKMLLYEYMPNKSLDFFIFG